MLYSLIVIALTSFYHDFGAMSTLLSAPQNRWDLVWAGVRRSLRAAILLGTASEVAPISELTAPFGSVSADWLNFFILGSCAKGYLRDRLTHDHNHVLIPSGSRVVGNVHPVDNTG